MVLPMLFASDQETMIIWTAIGAICIVPSVSYYLFRWRKTELDIELKRDMIARGMSADEIERVLAAGNSSFKTDKT